MDLLALLLIGVLIAAGAAYVFACNALKGGSR